MMHGGAICGCYNIILVVVVRVDWNFARSV